MITKAEALEQSIKKWEVGILQDGLYEIGIHDCALCQLYISDKCKGCPVGEATGEIECGGTPYQTWIAHQKSHRHWYKKVHCERCNEIAEAEVEFLKSLR